MRVEVRRLVHEIGGAIAVRVLVDRVEDAVAVGVLVHHVVHAVAVVVLVDVVRPPVLVLVLVRQPRVVARPAPRPYRLARPGRLVLLRARRGRARAGLRLGGAALLLRVRVLLEPLVQRLLRARRRRRRRAAAEARTARAAELAAAAATTRARGGSLRGLCTLLCGLERRLLRRLLRGRATACAGGAGAALGPLNKAHDVLQRAAALVHLRPQSE